MPLALWVLVWLGVKGGLAQGIFGSEDFFGFITRSRGIMPLLAAFFAVGMIVFNLSKQRSAEISLFGPLGFATVYGLVGLAATFLSPDGSVALYWAAVYLSVPLVLWGIVWVRGRHWAAYSIVNLNWMIIILAVMALFAIALLYLNLGTLIVTPSAWFDCPLYGNWQGNSWHDLTSGFLRPTGVARYAALAGILALGGVWQGRWRVLWVSILLASLILLLSSGARGAYLGFVFGAASIIFFYGGKKALAWGALGLILLAPVVWSTGVHKGFIDFCLSRQTSLSAPGVPLSVLSQSTVLLDLPIRVTVPGSNWVLEQVTPSGQDPPTATNHEILTSDSEGGADIPTRQPPFTQQQPLSEVFAQALVPLGLSVEPILMSEDTARTDPTPRVGLPEGVWQLKLYSSEEKTVDQQPIRIALPQGLLLMDRLGPDETFDPGLLVFPNKKSALITVSGRVSVWEDGYRLFKEQPLLGYGFHADRLILGTHMHNTFMHALVQTGLIGTIPFVIGLVFAWILLLKALWIRAVLPQVHKHLLIQVAGVLVFFSFRAIPESTGAFFGVDWLLLAPILLYLQIVNQTESKVIKQDSDPSPQLSVPRRLVSGGFGKNSNPGALLRRLVNRADPVTEVS